MGQLQAEVRGHRVNYDTFMMMAFLNGSGFFSLEKFFLSAHWIGPSLTGRSDPNSEQGRREGTAVVF